MRPLVILVTGWREWPEKWEPHGLPVPDALWKTACRSKRIGGLRVMRSRVTVINGGARGVDYIVNGWCQLIGLMPEIFPASAYGPWPQCGPIRNSAMVARCVELRDQGWDVVCLAFPGPDSRGTWDCVNKAKRAGIKVEIREWEER